MPRDQVDLIVGLGQSLYLSEIYGAAAELFDTALSRASLLAPRDRCCCSTGGRRRSIARRRAVRPIAERACSSASRARMNEEIQRDPGSAVANYWLAVSARGAGDIDGAWNSAVAAWVRSTLSPDTTSTLRDDLDRLVTQALIPERSRTRGRAENRRTQWRR